MRKQFDDHDLVDKETRQRTGIDWTMIRPAMLKGEEALPVKVHADDESDAPWWPSVSRKSVAEFLVEECAEKGQYVGRTPVICN